MPGLVPGIHVLRTAGQGVDGRDKPGHDGCGSVCAQAVNSEESSLRYACLHSAARDITRLRSFPPPRSLITSTNRKSKPERTPWRA
ncbi:hypothetical protein WN72_47135 [Bradyrhizobium arachidis]|uniref:Uncharacterized protein n=1 Tax=Bradyrhizobium arachidis TaxID=858423 RepID=A0AAE7TLC6_9BRAD|nr:hypothetical protein WN72_47135 [Bradyrhizobium arachidis]